MLLEGKVFVCYLLLFKVWFSPTDSRTIQVVSYLTESE